MRKMTVFLLIAVLSAGGCGKRYGLSEAELPQIKVISRPAVPGASGGFVVVVGSEPITSEEIVVPAMAQLQPAAQSSSFNEFRAKAGIYIEQLIASKVTNLLLYQRAKEKLGDKADDAIKKAVESETRRFVASFGGDTAKAEETLRKMGMDWKAFKEYQKKMILSQSYIQSQMEDKRPVTYSDLHKYYDAMKDDYFTSEAMIQFRLIDIQPARLEGADPNESRDEYARKLAGQLIRRIADGEDFGRLARQYSHGHRREFGGLWKSVRPESLAEPYDVLAKEAQKLKAGQTAGPIEAAGHLFIMKLEEKRDANVEAFEDVQDKLEAKIRFDRRKEAVDKLTTELIQQAEFGKKQEFVDFCLEEIYRRSNATG